MLHSVFDPQYYAQMFSKNNMVLYFYLANYVKACYIRTGINVFCHHGIARCVHLLNEIVYIALMQCGGGLH